MDRAAHDCIKVVSGECCTLSKGLEGAYASCAVGWYDILKRLQDALAEAKRGRRGKAVQGGTPAAEGDEG